MAETAQNGKKIAAEVLPIIKKLGDKKTARILLRDAGRGLIQVPVSRLRRQSRSMQVTSRE